MRDEFSIINRKIKSINPVNPRPDKPSQPDKSRVESPNTGDRMGIDNYLILIVISALCIFAITIKKNNSVLQENNK